MTDPVLSTSQRDITSAIIAFPDRRITWAGEGILPDSFLFGTEEGLLHECGVNGPLANAHPVGVSEDREAINGVSHFFDGDELHVGVTTRTEVIVHRYRGGSALRSFRLDYGADGIRQVADGWFIVPAGPTGLVALFRNDVGDYLSREIPSRDGVPYFYDIAPMGGGPESGKDVMVAACRTDGLIYVDASRTGLPVPFKASVIPSTVVDFVGVVSIGTAAGPTSFAALGKDRSIHFLRDPLRSPHIETLDFSYVPGTAYKLLRQDDHLLLLTSKGLCIIPDVIGQYRRGEAMGGYRSLTYMQVEAIDFNIAWGKWLLIVTPDGVVRMDLEPLLPRRTPVEIPDSIRKRMDPSFPKNWTEVGGLEELEQPIWHEASFKSHVLA